jgi:predicted DNA-binding ArsR family transcriptional regulator
MFEPIFATAFGDWIEANITTVVTWLLVAIGVVTAAVRIQIGLAEVKQDMEELDERVGKHESNFHIHTTDKDAHVNQLYIRSIVDRQDKFEIRMEKLEDSIDRGFERTMEKIERITEKIHTKKG